MRNLKNFMSVVVFGSIIGVSSTAFALHYLGSFYKVKMQIESKEQIEELKSIKLEVPDEPGTFVTMVPAQNYENLKAKGYIIEIIKQEEKKPFSELKSTFPTKYIKINGEDYLDYGGDVGPSDIYPNGVCLSPGNSPGSAWWKFQLPSDQAESYNLLKVGFYGHDPCVAGDGIEFLLYKWDENTWESFGQKGRQNTGDHFYESFNNPSIGHYISSPNHYVELMLKSAWSECGDISYVDCYYDYNPINDAPTASTPSGPTSGYIDTTYWFSSTGTDPDGDKIKIRFDWGDAISSWSSLKPSGSSFDTSHKWVFSEGNYCVKAQAKDEHGEIGAWSSCHYINITKPSNPKISVNPTSLDFGNINVGSSSAWSNLTITNTGTGKLNVQTPRVTGMDANQFDMQNDYPVELDAGQSFTYRVKFSPTSEGSKSANVNIRSNATNNPDLNVPLSGTGGSTGDKLELSVTPSETQILHWGQSYTFDITVIANGTPISNAKVSITDLINGSSTIQTNSSGQAQYGPCLIPVGTLEIYYELNFVASKAGYQNSLTLTRCIRVTSQPILKIWSVLQNTSINQNTLGFQVVAKVSPGSPQVNSVKIQWDNLDDSWPLMGPPYDMSRIGSSDFWEATVTANLPVIFDNGNRVIWRIEVDIGQQELLYYPGPNSAYFDTVTVLSYNSLNSGLRVLSNPSGVFRFEFQGDNITIYNNKALWFKLATAPQYTIDNGFHLPFDENMIPAKIGFWSGIQPHVSIDNMTATELTINAAKLDSIALVHDFVDGFILSALEFWAPNELLATAVSGFMFALNKTPILAEVALGIDRHDSIDKIITSMIDLIRIDLGNPNSIIRKEFLDYLVEHGFKESVVKEVLSDITVVISALRVINDMGSFFFDFATISNDNTFVIDNRNSVRVKANTNSLPGQSSPLLVGSNQTFAVTVENISNYKLYNLWIGLDIFNFEHRKVENTQTPIPDPLPDGTGKIGTIIFNFQGIDLLPWETFTFKSQPYSFATSVTNFNYSADTRNYYYLCRIWTNGYPGGTEPKEAVPLTEVKMIPFKIKDNIAPIAPEFTCKQLYADSVDTHSVYLVWARDSSDNDVVEYKLYRSTDSSGMYELFAWAKDSSGIERDSTVEAYDGTIGGALLIERDSTETYYYKLKAKDLGNLESPLSTDYAIVTPVFVSVEEGTANIPKEFKLHQSYSNPFTSTTVIRYDVPKESKVMIKIYNSVGQVIRILVDEIKPAGCKTVHWDGRDGQGRSVSSGVYFYRLEAGDFTASSRMTLLR